MMEEAPQMHGHQIVDPKCLYSSSQVKYDLDEDFIGQGGFSEVYKATLTKADGQMRMVAAKMVCGGHGYCQNMPRRLAQKDIHHLLNEAHILLQIPAHENIVQLVGVCPEPNKYVLLLEYVEGPDLNDLLHSDGDIEWPDRLEVANQITKGMMHLHSLRPPIIHMDLKSKNVLTSKEGQKYHCKITDFGLSKAREISYRSSIHKGPVGTLGFIAPELYVRMVKQSDTEAPKVDVYSFAVIMWQLKERALPYEGELPQVIEANIKAGIFPEVSDTPCPGGFVELMKSCSQKEPTKRPSFADVNQQLKTIKQQITIPSTADAERIDAARIEEAAHQQRFIVRRFSWLRKRIGRIAQFFTRRRVDQGPGERAANTATGIVADAAATGSIGAIENEDGPAYEYINIFRSVKEKDDQNGAPDLPQRQSALVHGHIPPNLQPFRQLDRQDAEALLRRSLCVPGSFIVRWSTSSLGSIVISLRIREVTLSDDNVVHYLIKQANNGHAFYLNPASQFPSLHDLLAHHQNHADGLPSNLVAPCCCHPTADNKKVDPWAFESSTVSLKEKFGIGNLMDLYHADLTCEGGSPKSVTVKRYGHEGQEQFFREVSVMKTLHHKNVLELYGMVSEPPRYYYLVFEPVKCTLHQHVCKDSAKVRALENPLKLETTDVGLQICCGMAYLHKEGYLHRHLTASSVCVQRTRRLQLHCLIGDLHSACEVGHEATATCRRRFSDISALPKKWMAPEAILNSVFSRKSDVWSFGILMMEIVSGGVEPYPGLTDEDVLDRLLQGYRMPQPADDCDYQVFQLIQSCWEMDPLERRTFYDLLLEYDHLRKAYQKIVDAEKDSLYGDI